MTIKKNHIVSTIFSITGLLLVSKLLGFVKQMVTASAFGATLETDLINLSQGLIGNFQYLLVQSVLSALIAVYLHTAQQGGDASRRFAFDVWKALTVLTAMVVLFVELCAPWLARLIAPSYPAEQIVQLSRYLRLFAPVLLLLTWIAGNLWNAGYTAILSRHYWTVSRGNPFRNPAVRELLRMMGPLLLGYSLVYINQMVDKMLVSGLEAGAVTALNYAAVLSNLVGTFITTFASILFAYVTTRIAAGDADGAAQLTERTALLLSVIFLPITILTVLLSEDIVTIVYARGAFDAESVRICARALRGYALMFVPMVFQEVYGRFQYGYQDSKHPMVNSSIGIVFNIVLSVALCPRYGVLGVAFATSMSYVTCGVLNICTARKLSTALSFRPYLRLLPFLALCGTVCGVIARSSATHLAAQNALLRFALSALIGMAAYAACASPLLLRLWRQLRQNDSSKS